MGPIRKFKDVFEEFRAHATGTIFKTPSDYAAAALIGCDFKANIYILMSFFLIL